MLDLPNLKLECVQYSELHVVSCTCKFEHTTSAIKYLHWLSPEENHLQSAALEHLLNHSIIKIQGVIF